MSVIESEIELDGFCETVREPSKPSRLGFSLEEAAERAARNRAARLRFAATEADRAERLKGEPVEHRPRGEVAPTAATRARLRPDVLRRLFHRGAIDQDQLLAAGQIREVYEAVVRDLMARIGRLEAGAKRRTAFAPSIERLPACLARCYVEVYLPWAAAHATRSPILRRSALEIVVDVVVENRPIRDVAAGLGMRTAAAKALVVEILAAALRDYADRACEKALDRGNRDSA